MSVSYAVKWLASKRRKRLTAAEKAKEGGPDGTARRNADGCPEGEIRDDANHCKKYRTATSTMPWVRPQSRRSRCLAGVKNARQTSGARVAKLDGRKRTSRTQDGFKARRDGCQKGRRGSALLARTVQNGWSEPTAERTQITKALKSCNVVAAPHAKTCALPASTRAIANSTRTATTNRSQRLP